MRNRRFHRRSGGGRTKVRTFWIRNTGVLQFGTAGLRSGIVLFDPLQMNPSAADQRADINRNLVVLAQKMNFTTSFTTTVSTGTSLNINAYFGIVRTHRTVGVASPAFSTADDARSDWLDVWMDYFANANTAPATYQSVQTINMTDNGDAMRTIKSKRVLEAEDVLVLCGVFFGQGGTLTGTYQLTCQWQYSALCRIG